jgi:CelD/BcsL family acetyltransferase involved in cellulose biosynthesis
LSAISGVTLDVSCTLSLEKRFVSEWSCLLDATPSATIFNTHGWLRSNLEAFPPRSLEILKFRSPSGELVGGIPLVLRRGRKNFRTLNWLELASMPHADYGGLLIHPSHAEAVIATLLAYVSTNRACHGVFLQHMFADCSFTQMLASNDTRGVPTPGLRLIARPAWRIRRIEETRNVLAAAELLGASRGLRKDFRRLGRLGDLRFDVLADVAAIGPALEGFFSMHVAKFAAKQKVSPLVNEVHRDFYRAIVRNLASSGNVQLTVLRVGERPVAQRLCLLYDSTLYLYAATYDPAYRMYSPGIVHLAHLLRHAVDIGLCCVDFGIGDAPHKLEIRETLTRDIVDVEMYRSLPAYLESQASAYVRERAARSTTVARIARLGRKFLPFHM